MRHLAIAACLAVAGSSASAQPAHHHRHRHHKLHVATTEEVVDAPVEIRERATPPQDWHFAIGPNVWASSVDAKVTLGSQTVSSGVNFIDISHHAKYGVPLLAEIRRGKLSVVGDFTYGVIGIDGSKDVGPLTASIDGTASSLMFDGYAGYLVAGDEHSLFAFEARAGVRYQRTAIEGSLMVGSTPVTSAQEVDGGIDALGGARVLVRPSERIWFAGAADIGVVGSSSNTWSASFDGSVRITTHTLLTLGWKTMEMDRAYVAMQMKGPRAAFQLLF
jgi:hypothetical protein